MCDATEEIDELIEYELTRDCDLVVEEHEEFQQIEEEEEELASAVIEEEEIPVDDELEDQKPIIIATGIVQSDETLAETSYDIYEAVEEHVLPEYEPCEELDEQDMKPIIPLPRPTGPTRYLLFDELVATIVDYDADNTPIVEFALSNAEADDKLPVECGICPDVMHKTKLTKHLKTHLVPGTNRYACIYCEESYKDYKYLAGHARRHMGIRPYVCEPCKLYFSTKQDLRVHNQRRHHAKELICEICGKTFSQNTMLKRHRESTHEKKRRFQCDHCPKAYYKNFSLQEHVRSVHMGERRMLVCPFCGMQCRDAHKMARHRKQYHLNQTHFECNICHEEFTDINYFDAHKRSIQCRNNTRRKLEEAQQQVMQETEEQKPEQQLHELQQAQTEELVYEITIQDNENI